MFGLIVGFEVIAFAIVTFFDKSVRISLIREIAGNRSRPAHARGIIQSYGMIVWSFTAVAAIAFWLLAPLLAQHVFDIRSVPADTATLVIRLLLLKSLLLVLAALYRSIIEAAERIGTSSLVDITATLAQRLGVVGLLLLHFDGMAVCAWLGFVALLQLAAFMITATREFRTTLLSLRPQFSVLREAMNYRLHLIAAVTFSTIQRYAEIALISATMPIAAAGFYATLQNVTSKTTMIAGGLGKAVYPHICAIVEKHDPKLVTAKFVELQSVTSFLTIHAWGLGMMAGPILLSLVLDQKMAAELALPYAVMLLGYAFSNMVSTPWLFLLAFGESELAARTNGISALLTVPLTYLLVSSYGLLGAGAALIVYNLIVVAVAVAKINRHCRDVGLKEWLQSVLAPWAAVLPPYAVGVWIVWEWRALGLWIAIPGGLLCPLAAAALSYAVLPRPVRAKGRKMLLQALKKEARTPSSPIDADGILD